MGTSIAVCENLKSCLKTSAIDHTTRVTIVNRDKAITLLRSKTL